MTSVSSADPVGAAFDLDKLVLRVQEEIYTLVAPLRITAWHTAEPVPFERRTEGVRCEPGIGDPWGESLFDCAWMRFTADLPAVDTTRGPLVVRIDINGELLLVDAVGEPVRGLTCIKSTFDRRLGGPAKTIYQLPPDKCVAGSLELWGDAGLNDLFGRVQDGGRIALAEVALCREDVRQLYYDLETLRDYRAGLAADDPFLGELNAVIAEVERTLDCGNPSSVAAVRARLAPWFRSGSAERFRNGSAVPLQIHAIGHAHIDLAWLWPIRETIRKGARTFASVLYNLERYPEYVFGCSQPQLFAWMKEFYPGLYSRVKDAVRAGRIEPQGTFWVEPDCNIPNGESFVRQVLHGAKFFREEFGIVPRYCWEPDVFGYHGQLPQILRKSGHDYFMTQKLSWNVVNRFGHHSFHWEGIDGTRILTHMLPEETYNGPGAPRSLKKIHDNYFERDVSNHALMTFGIGDGGGGPDAEHLERLRRGNGLPALPSVVIEPAVKFFETWSRDAEKFPSWSGELYLERHQGTLTTQARTKRHNRLAEIALRELEWAAYLATTFADVSYPAEALDRLWKEVLLYQFHDILPGSSIKRVYDECGPRYEAILAELETLTAERYAALAGGGETLFNSLSWPRSEWVKHDDAWHHVEVPALSSADFQSASVFQGGRLEACATLLENECLRVTFAEDGRIASIFDKAVAREVLAPGEYANAFLVFHDTGDAWDFEIDYERKDVWRYLEQAGRSPTLRETRAWIDGPHACIEQVWAFAASEIRQTIRLTSGSALLEFDTQVEWRETASMLRVHFPVAVTADEALFEIPFGSIRRSTREDTLIRRAQLEVAMHQWADLSQADYGVALLNDCKYGVRLKGHTIDLNLLRSVPHPATALIGKDDVSDAASSGVYTDLGTHVFRYALMPHAGPADTVALTKAAREFNVPLRRVSGTGRAHAMSAQTLKINSPAIEVAALKQSEDGAGWALRLVNVTDAPVSATLTPPLDAGILTECDLVEQPLQVLTGESGSGVRLDFSPFEIKTLCWKRPL